jgi:ubiquinone/menaquinone biosynthesis C-methylase UbiE
VGWLDSVLYRHPFEGRSARRYQRAERPAFADFDDRLLDRMAVLLAGARRLLDLGSGPGTFAARAAARHPQLSVIAVEPSRDFVTPGMVRARGEELPFADGVIDVAICQSSIRHVRDRAATLRELRRVVSGALVIVELDPDADATRIAAHADRLGGWLLRRAFGPLVVRTAPRSEEIARGAREAGWTVRSCDSDREQPLYIMELA